MLKDYDFFVFDCDGVILCSNQLKSSAFAAALEGEAEDDIKAFVNYHQANGGVSRYRKFAHYFENMAPRADAATALERALSKYAEIVQRDLLQCPLVPGVEELLHALKTRGAPCAVNSGGDESELHVVFEKRGLMPYFHQVLGSPKTKSQNMQLLADAGFMRGKGMMFGDSKSDFNAAAEFGLDFMFVTHESEWVDGRAVCKDAGFSIINDFLSLKPKLLCDS